MLPQHQKATNDIKKLSISNEGASIPSISSSHVGQNCFDPMLQKNQKVTADSSFLQNFKYALSLPPHNEVLFHFIG